MFPVTSGIVRAVPNVCRTIIPMRTSVISGPPRNKVSTLEKAIGAVLISASFLFVPGYVLVNMKRYTAGLN